MIAPRELQRRAAELGISIQHVEIDYALSHVLAAIAEDPGDLVFRGGTALARIYWPDFRISEDLDFISAGAAPALEHLLTGSSRRAVESTGLELVLDFGRPRDDRSRSFVRWETPWGSSGELLIDVVTFERAVLEVLERPLLLPYSDLTDTARIPAMDVHEILASKWLMLDDRDEPRDLFDLWWALTREVIAFADIADAHRVMYGHPPMLSSIERAKRLGGAWEQRLAHQLSDPPPFEEALDVIEAAFGEWRDTQTGQMV